MLSLTITCQGKRTDIRAVSPNPELPDAGRKLATVTQVPGGYRVELPPTVSREPVAVATWGDVLRQVERAA